MTAEHFGNIRRAIRTVNAAKESLHTQVAEAFPIGSDVHWDRGGNLQYGKVVGHGSPAGRCGEIRVENARSGARYWIGMYSILGYVE